MSPESSRSLDLKFYMKVWLPEFDALKNREEDRERASHIRIRTKKNPPKSCEWPNLAGKDVNTTGSELLCRHRNNREEEWRLSVEVRAWGSEAVSQRDSGKVRAWAWGRGRGTEVRESESLRGESWDLRWERNREWRAYCVERLYTRSQAPKKTLVQTLLSLPKISFPAKKLKMKNSKTWQVGN